MYDNEVVEYSRLLTRMIVETQRKTGKIDHRLLQRLLCTLGSKWSHKYEIQISNGKDSICPCVIT